MLCPDHNASLNTAFTYFKTPLVGQAHAQNIPFTRLFSSHKEVGRSQFITRSRSGRTAIRTAPLRLGSGVCHLPDTG